LEIDDEERHRHASVSRCEGANAFRGGAAQRVAHPPSPLAGFFAKFYVFLAAIQAGLFALAVIGVLASVVGAYYYLLIIKIMYFDEPARPFEPMPYQLKAVLAVSGLFNLLFFVYPGPLVEAANAAAKSLF
jgi:NADH-quinone oxidoreductase subunit N